MTLLEHQKTFALNVSALIKFIFDCGYFCTFGEAMRTPEQAEIYAKEGKGVRNSLHCKRLAVDLNIFKKDGTFLQEAKDYEQFGIFWEKLHGMNRWGGFFVSKYGGKIIDGNHFDMLEP